MNLALFPLSALLLTFAATMRSLGWGLVVLFAFGYFNGYIRANYLSVFTTFMFDCGVLGLYLGFLIGHTREVQQAFSGTAGQWVLILILWPMLLTFLPVNDFLVQLVALRATIWFLPCLLVATRLRPVDLHVLSRGLAVLNLLALGGGMYVYWYGVHALYPLNAVTQIIYMSNDVAGYQYHRVPSFFLNAHAYGGTMLFTLPFLLDRLVGRQATLIERLLAAIGAGAALFGILLCAARQPVVQLVLATAVCWIITRMNLLVCLVLFTLLGVGWLIASTSERFQRFRTLEDSEFVSQRLRLSANESFFQLMLDYPAGAGMGSSFGTSIPYFLSDRAPRQIGLENEYTRILVDQGLIGLGLWLAFLIWLLRHPPPLRLDVSWGLAIILMYALVLTHWCTAFIGAGTLSSIPHSLLLLIQMGLLVRVREVCRQWA